MARNSRNPRIGSNFEEYLEEVGELESATAVALKSVIASQITAAMKARGLTKKAMAEKMQTSRSHLDRLLDEKDAGLTLEVLSRAARVLGCTVRIQLAPA